MKSTRVGQLLLLFLFVASLAIAGCAATTLLYNHSDWLIARQIDGYFGLNWSIEEGEFAWRDLAL